MEVRQLAERGEAMSQETTNAVGVGGTGLGTVLFLIFLTLKLTKHIGWSWWWVTSPLWIPWSIIAVVFLVAVFLVRR